MTVTDTPTDQDFEGVIAPYRRELLAHCYRMLGSVHDAEDLVQETFLRAWRSYHQFEGRSSMRTWLYRIATNVCLTALDTRNRRPMPTGLGNPGSQAGEPLVESNEVPWLEPVPDSAVGLDATDPASIVTSRESVRLALIAALQHLPPRQRAVLILRDVLAWKAAEVAELLDTSTAAVNSSLQRARAQLEQVSPSQDEVTEPTSAETTALLERYVAAFERKDIAAMIDLFTKDAVWEMPPFLSWYQGPENIARLVDTQCPAKGPGDMRLIPTSANGQPAFGLYMRGEDGVHRAFNLPVLTVTAEGVSHVASFFDLSLFETFGLPLELPMS
ncbi:sigma-70 family RNA polymerase sigma factor [Kutzneria viridogrisea]|uniref:RNA polymerase sigma factor n=2 Tax=Kutzneria TaxID=43356 RepID=W5W423_9PSEU|nr:sigma-70 family RNA polymerase sigma factor [Kutzneria albida]AHH95196.1 RNA polymerase sigma-70 factor family protein [Kutzneria albida DSM 43870]MBA8927447.1 RNA polymerase sigma-70 factor (ECF subfamily) [Kutzneria viridogrisea]